MGRHKNFRKRVKVMKNKIRVVIYNNSTNKEEGLLALEECKEYVASNKNMELVRCYEDYYPQGVKIQERKALRKLFDELGEVDPNLIVIDSVKNLTENDKEKLLMADVLRELNIESTFVKQHYSVGLLGISVIMSNMLNIDHTLANMNAPKQNKK